MLLLLILILILILLKALGFPVSSKSKSRIKSKINTEYRINSYDSNNRLFISTLAIHFESSFRNRKNQKYYDIRKNVKKSFAECSGGMAKIGGRFKKSSRNDNYRIMAEQLGLSGKD